MQKESIEINLKDFKKLQETIQILGLAITDAGLVWTQEQRKAYDTSEKIVKKHIGEQVKLAHIIQEELQGYPAIQKAIKKGLEFSEKDIEDIKNGYQEA